MRKLVLLGLLVILNCLIVSAANRVISNSEDWRDVYSIIQYANLQGKKSEFLVSQRHSSILLNTLPAESDIELISSSSYPFTTGFESMLNSRGFTVEELSSASINLDLAGKLTDIKDFIIIDDSYGYNAVSVAPYAQISNSYVLFADRNNINAVDSFLSDRNPDEVIIFGHVNREVKDTLSKYNPEIINNGGDRFANNLEIVKKYLEISPTKQVILTNGEFIEQEIMSGVEPVIFIGANNVPDQVREFITEEGIEVGVLIGNQYVGTATTIRRQAGISVFVKFARSARTPDSAISPVEGLDLFYLPAYRPNLEIASIVYNQLTNELEVTLRNTVDLAAYFMGTYRLSWEGGGLQTRGESEPIYIDGLEYKTVVHGDLEPMTGDITGEIRVIYGESKGSLEFSIDQIMIINVSEVADNSKIRIISVTYNKLRNEFIIEIENIGDVDTYVDLELVDIIIAGERFTYGSDKVTHIKAGEKKKIRIKVDLEDVDFEDNEKVRVVVRYGEREQALVKSMDETLEVVYEVPNYIVYGVAAAIILLILFLLAKIRKKKCRSCKHKNPSGRRYCKKCGADLK